MAIWQQAIITQTNVDPDLSGHMVSLGRNELAHNPHPIFRPQETHCEHTLE